MARLIMIGRCEKCGSEVTSRFPFQLAECLHCNPPVEVSLKLAILPAPRIQKALQRVSQLSGVPFDKLVNAMLEEAGKAALEGRLTIQYRI